MLTKLLEKAERGEISSIAGVSFKSDGDMDYWGEFTEKPDMKRAGVAIEELKRQTIEFAGED